MGVLELVWALRRPRLPPVNRIKSACFIVVEIPDRSLHGSLSGQQVLLAISMPASSAVRGARCSTITDSCRACAPSPTAPMPSSVGMPSAAVKFPSDAPPVAASSSTKPVRGPAPAPYGRAGRSRGCAPSAGG